MKLVCDKDMCNGCGACAAIYPANAIHIQEDVSINEGID